MCQSSLRLTDYHPHLRRIEENKEAEAAATKLILDKTSTLTQLYDSLILLLDLKDLYTTMAKLVIQHPEYKFHFVFKYDYVKDKKSHLEWSKLFYEPRELLTLMKLNPKLGHPLINSNPGLREIINIQELDTKEPELGIYVIKELVVTGMNQCNDYDIEVIEALGKVFIEKCEIIQDLKKTVLEKMHMQPVYFELGKMCLNHLNNHEIEPSQELLNLMALGVDEHNRIHSNNPSFKMTVFNQVDLTDYNNFFQTVRNNAKETISELFPKLVNTSDVVYFLAMILYETCLTLDPQCTHESWPQKLENLKKKFDLVNLIEMKHECNHSSMLESALKDAVQSFNKLNQSKLTARQTPSCNTA